IKRKRSERAARIRAIDVKLKVSKTVKLSTGTPVAETRAKVTKSHARVGINNIETERAVSSSGTKNSEPGRCGHCDGNCVATNAGVVGGVGGPVGYKPIHIKKVILSRISTPGSPKKNR